MDQNNTNSLIRSLFSDVFKSFSLVPNLSLDEETSLMTRLKENEEKLADHLEETAMLVKVLDFVKSLHQPPMEKLVSGLDLVMGSCLSTSVGRTKEEDPLLFNLATKRSYSPMYLPHTVRVTKNMPRETKDARKKVLNLTRFGLSPISREVSSRWGEVENKIDSWVTKSLRNKSFSDDFTHEDLEGEDLKKRWKTIQKSFQDLGFFQQFGEVITHNGEQPSTNVSRLLVMYGYIPCTHKQTLSIDLDSKKSLSTQLVGLQRFAAFWTEIDLVAQIQIRRNIDLGLKRSSKVRRKKPIVDILKQQKEKKKKQKKRARKQGKDQTQQQGENQTQQQQQGDDDNDNDNDNDQQQEEVEEDQQDNDAVENEEEEISPGEKRKIRKEKEQKHLQDVNNKNIEEFNRIKAKAEKRKEKEEQVEKERKEKAAEEQRKKEKLKQQKQKKEMKINQNERKTNEKKRKAEDKSKGGKNKKHKKI
jgi:hypothetical protein